MLLQLRVTSLPSATTQHLKLPLKRRSTFFVYLDVDGLISTTFLLRSVGLVCVGTCWDHGLTHLSCSWQVVNSFEDEYKDIIQSLPDELKPQSTTHGKHSFTTSVEGLGRIEVLLRQRALKPKATPSGKPIKAKSTLNVNYTVLYLCVSLVLSCL